MLLREPSAVMLMAPLSSLCPPTARAATVSVDGPVRAASRRAGEDADPLRPAAPTAFSSLGTARRLKFVRNSVCIKKRVTLRSDNG